jgi:large subunit ribosomal protein L33
MAKKGARVIITLECTEAKKEGKPASRYTTMKNKQNTTERLEIKKYNPFLKRHTVLIVVSGRTPKSPLYEGLFSLWFRVRDSCKLTDYCRG